MANPHKVYYVIHQFLVCRGYDETQRVEGTEDGHMILHYVKELMESSCANNPKGDCAQKTFTLLFQSLEEGRYLTGQPLAPGESHWKRQDTNQALMAGGFPPWSEKS